MVYNDDSTLCKLSLVSLNNEGVNMMMEGRYCQAAQAFASAIQMCDESCPDGPDASSDWAFDQIVDCVYEHEDNLSVIPNIHQNDSSSSRWGVNSVEDGQSFIVFQLPMLVVDENQPSNSQSPSRHRTKRSRTQPMILSDLPSWSAYNHRGSHHERVRRRPCAKTRLDFLLFYNLALSYHLSVLCEFPCHSSSATILQTAVEWYKRAYIVLLAEEEVPEAQAMVILNNVGQIYKQLNDEAGAKRCFQRLLSTMLSIHRSGDAPRIEYWNTFVTNVWCGLMSNGSSSFMTYLPAAAA